MIRDLITTYTDSLSEGTPSFYLLENSAYVRDVVNLHLIEILLIVKNASKLRSQLAIKPGILQLKPANTQDALGAAILQAKLVLASDSGALSSVGNFSLSFRIQRDIALSLCTRLQRIKKAIKLTLQKAALNKRLSLVFI